MVSTGEIAHAAEVKVLASVALNSALDDLTSVYEKETGNKLSIGYGPSAIPERPRGDRKTGIITQPFVAWTFETVSGQVHDRSKWVRVKNKPRAGP